mgnify:CR=1 FL=1
MLQHNKNLIIINSKSSSVANFAADKLQYKSDQTARCIAPIVREDCRRSSVDNLFRCKQNIPNIGISNKIAQFVALSNDVSKIDIAASAGQSLTIHRMYTSLREPES